MNKDLFRAKRKDNGEFIYWNIYGELCRESGKKARLAISKAAGESYYHHVHQIKHLLIPETVGQYTGLTDKNGKKVFEGDVVVLRACRPHEVKYSNGGFELIGTAIPIRNVDRFEIIGNIHDNPELFGGNENE